MEVRRTFNQESFLLTFTNIKKTFDHHYHTLFPFASNHCNWSKPFPTTNSELNSCNKHSQSGFSLFQGLLDIIGVYRAYHYKL